MKTFSEKTQEKHSPSTANEISQRKISGTPAFQFVDNRPEAIAQRKMQSIINKSSRSTTIQRHVNGASNMQQVANDPDLWALYMVLNGADRDTFKLYLTGEADWYPAVLNMATIEIRNWFTANAAAIMGGAPTMVTRGGQDVGHYQYPHLARFRWHNAAGPNGSTIATLGINLHRGPIYSDEGNAWVKLTNNITVPVNPGALLGAGALTPIIEPHAAGVGLQDNNNLP